MVQLGIILTKNNVLLEWISNIRNTRNDHYYLNKLIVKGAYLIFSKLRLTFIEGFILFLSYWWQG